MMMHHVLTVWLILNSFVGNELPIGLVVLACHDISDIALDLMKMVSQLMRLGGGYVGGWGSDGAAWCCTVDMGMVWCGVVWCGVVWCGVGMAGMAGGT